MSERRVRRVAGLVWVIFGVVWSTVEGGVTAVVLLGASGAALLGWWLLATRLRRWRASRWGWMVATAVVGLFAGLAAIFLTLGFMAFKTGLHGHGPEYSPEDIAWVLAQGRSWVAGGGVAGLGLGLITLPVRRAAPDGVIVDQSGEGE